VDVYEGGAVPWLRLLVVGFSSQKTGFDSRSLRVGFVIGNMAWELIFLRILLL
jgi:hypothetical protein